MKFSILRLLQRLKVNAQVRFPLFSWKNIKAAYRIAQLRQIVSILRGPEGCPWDRKQTLNSILPDLREEVMEAIIAGQHIQDDQGQHFKEELGDVLFLLLFLSQFSEEDGYFTIADATENVIRKMLRRHPHVFGLQFTNDEKEIKKNWEKIKAQERQNSPQTSEKSILDDIPEILPALHLTQRISEKVANAGFDWENTDEVWKKVHEEIDELKEAIAHQDKKQQEAELGDLLFTIVNLARHLRVDSENALLGTCHRFSQRFRYVEKLLKEEHLSLESASIETLENLWQRAKSSIDKEHNEKNNS